MAKADESVGALEGIRVLELGSTIAGPFCARLLADFGADVIKLEPPAGDAVRSMGNHKDGVSLYAASILRGKRLIAVNLKTDAGLEVARALVRKSDIVVENFRPGTLERLGLGYDALSALNPGIILVRISGFGQTGPYAERAGYGVVAEAVGGIRHLIGDPDRPPARVAIALTDMIGALYGAYGALMAVHARSRTGRGQCIDLALFEAAFSFMEPHVPAFDQLGLVPARMGSGLPNSAPNNLYPTREGGYVHIAAFGEAVFRRFAEAIRRPDLARNEKFAKLLDRARNKEELDEIVGEWTARHETEDVERVLLGAGVPVSRVYTIADVFADAHYAAREMLPTVPHPALGDVRLAGVVPKLSATPGVIRWPGAAIGAHTREVLTELLDFPAARTDALVRAGAIRCES